jgi:predicted nuclease with TOPRIM domain
MSGDEPRTVLGETIPQRGQAREAELEQRIITMQAEIDSLRVLRNENFIIREESNALRDRLRRFEGERSHFEDRSVTAETQAQLAVKLQAYQRHNTHLQGELSARETKISAMQEKIDVLTEEMHRKDRRCSILAEKLRQHNIDPVAVAATTIHVPEEFFAQLKKKISSQETTIDALHERLEGLQEDAQRRELVVEALQRENSALRQSVSRLIAQINAEAIGNDATASPESESKLRTWRSRKTSAE